MVVGGRTGRDGIHGVTFSSVQLDEKSSEVSFSAVQIGNPIVEKKMLDVLLQARDLGLYSRITDCGAAVFLQRSERWVKIPASVLIWIKFL